MRSVSTLEKGRSFAADGDLRFAAELLKHAVYADPGNRDATTALADVLERLGFGAENATWRGFYSAVPRNSGTASRPRPWISAAGWRPR